MPNYRFCLEGNTAPTRGIALDLPDESVIGLVAKQAARHLASDVLHSGQLSLSRNLLVLDGMDVEVARYPLSDFISVNSGTAEVAPA